MLVYAAWKGFVAFFSTRLYCVKGVHVGSIDHCFDSVSGPVAIMISSQKKSDSGKNLYPPSSKPMVA